MQPQKGQVLMYDDKELELIKAVFCDNDDLIYAIRAVLLQFPITATQKVLLKSTLTPEVYDLIRKRFCLELRPESPLTNIGDIYQTLNNDLKSKGVTEMAPLFDAKQLEVDYMNQQFAVLKDVDARVSEVLRLDDFASLKDKTPYERYVQTTARNFILGYVDPALSLLKSLAGQKTESVEDAKKRATRDSSK